MPLLAIFGKAKPQFFASRPDGRRAPATLSSCKVGSDSLSENAMGEKNKEKSGKEKSKILDARG
jgi:hypothetical protein